MFDDQFVVDEKFLIRFPLKTSEYIQKEIGAFVKDVRMSVNKTDFVAITPFLSGIHTLELNIIGWSCLPLWVFDIFPCVRCLRGNFGVTSWYNLFSHLNPTLQELDCSKVTTKDLKS